MATVVVIALISLCYFLGRCAVMKENPFEYLTTWGIGEK